MLTLTMPADAKPVCAAPEYLSLVDAAFEDIGGPESHWMRQRLCTGCPVRAECLRLSMVDGEWGMWGGVPMKERTALGAPRARAAHNIAGDRR